MRVATDAVLNVLILVLALGVPIAGLIGVARRRIIRPRLSWWIMSLLVIEGLPLPFYVLVTAGQGGISRTFDYSMTLVLPMTATPIFGLSSLFICLFALRLGPPWWQLGIVGASAVAFTYYWIVAWAVEPFFWVVATGASVGTTIWMLRAAAHLRRHVPPGYPSKDRRDEIAENSGG